MLKFLKNIQKFKIYILKKLLLVNLLLKVKVNLYYNYKNITYYNEMKININKNY